MLHITDIREANAQARQFEGLVAVFVGGTGGIGEGTAKELFAKTTRPKAYIVGRSEKNGAKVMNELQEINPDGQCVFLQKDISLIRNTDEVCEEIIKREGKINCLFLTTGYLTLRGRQETVEGLDRKMSTNYYSRVRWILNLMPLLQAASDRDEISRVITVLGAGAETEMDLDDLGLKHNFRPHSCLVHCVVMSDLIVEELAERYPDISFSHSYPGTVKTGLTNELTRAVRLAVKVLYSVMTPWILDVQESGERHFFQMTNQCYPSKWKPHVGIPPPGHLTTMVGANGEIGSGAYLLDWDGTPISTGELLTTYRQQGVRQRVWEHTMAAFQEAERLNPKVAQGPAGQGAEHTAPQLRDPVGWRPA